MCHVVSTCLYIKSLITLHFIIWFLKPVQGRIQDFGKGGGGGGGVQVMLSTEMW